MLKSFNGIIKNGTGSATTNLQKQIPLIAKQFPEIADVYRGTINIQLESKDFRVSSPDFITKAIDWRNGHTQDKKADGPEVFHFTRICIQPANMPRYCMWIYGPQQSPHLKEPGYIEVIAQTKIEGCQVENTCILFIDDAKLDTAGR